MDRKLRTLKSALLFLFLVCLLFAGLALLPAWAKAQGRGRAGPDEPFGPDAGILALPSTTGYVIDDGDAGFSPAPPYPTGNWLYFGGGGYKGDVIYTLADDSGDAAEWRPDLATGVYEVQAHWWANQATQRDDALFTIHYNGGSYSRRVDQRRDAAGILVAGANSGWYSFGQYPFVGGTAGYVTLSDITSASGTGTNVVADGVRFLPLAVWVDDNYCSGCTNDGHLWGVNAFDNIRDGVMAVASLGTVNVGPGLYTQSITVTKPITLSGAGWATTVITVPAATDTAIEMLASNVRISGFTIESAGATYGIRNYRTAAPTGWQFNLTGYRILNNRIRGFRDGIYVRRCSGEISNNSVYNNTRRGIRVQDFPTVAPALTTISANVLYANGSGATDYDIQVEDSYTGTMVTGNTITGSGAANEVGIYVLNRAGDLTLSANSITGCTRGVWIYENASFDVQKVNLHGNTITAGTTGIRVEWGAGVPVQRQVIVGGSVANANSIHGNSGYELEVPIYSANITATYNDWGVCTLRGIEDEIYHHYDNPLPSIGTVTYEPALCVPYTIDVEAAPTSLPADGISAATITATVRDVAGQRALPGTMIGITTSLGSVPYGYAEAEDTSQVVRTGTWTLLSTAPWSRASGGQLLRASAATRLLTWAFTGQAVSLLYTKDALGGKAEVRVDGTLIKTIDMSSSVREFRVEEVITTTLDPSVSHTIEVRPDGTGNIWIDAFRSGGVVATQGRITTMLTSTTTHGIAAIWATVYDGKIVTSTSAALYPIITDTTSVAFEAADVYVSKNATPTSINAGQEVTYTITYGNYGPEIATNALVTDTLPANFLYVRSKSSPNREPPTSAPGNKYVWHVGNLASGATGSITLVARPDPAATWAVTVTVSNVAEIATDVPDAVAGNNASGPVDVTIVMPATIAISAHPPAIRVSNGTIATTLRITVTDSNSNLVHGVPISLTTTAGSFPASGGTTLIVTTTNGIAQAQLASGPTVTTATVTAAVMPTGMGLPTASVQVRFLPGLPFAITSTAYPTLIRVCGDSAVVTATITDEFGHLVEDGTEVTFNVVQGDRGEMYPRLTTTLNGIATSIVRTKGYRFGERFLDVYILAKREAVQVVWYQRIDLEEGPPHNITVTASPPVIPVGGRESEITALVQDCGGNNVQNGTVVTFTVSSLGTITPTVTSTTNGRAYAIFKSGCTVGTAWVSAAADSRSGSTTVTLEPGPADLISVGAPSPTSVRNCGGQAVIVATVYDVCGNLVKDDTPVLFTPQYNYVDAEPKLAYTRGGMVTTTVTALDKLLETWPTALEQIDVTSGSAFPGFTSLTILPGLAENVEVSADPDSIPINGDVNFYDIIVVARVTDCSDTPVDDGTAVTLRTSLGLFRESGMRSLPRTTLNGLVTGTLTSQSIAGLVTITGTANSAVGTAEVRFLPGDPWLLDVWGYPTTIYANGMSTSLITALVKDEYNNPVLDGITVTFVTDYGLFVQSGDVVYTTTTSIDGFAFVTLLSDPIPRTALVRAIAYNDRQGYTYVFFVTPPEMSYLYLPLVKRRAP